MKEQSDPKDIVWGNFTINNKELTRKGCLLLLYFYLNFTI
jgi:hypothetical protein